MAIKVSQEAKAALSGRPLPNPDNDLQLALWAMPARKDRTLMMVRKSDGKMFRVIEFDAPRMEIVLERPGAKESWAKKSRTFRISLKGKPDIWNQTWEPFWR